MNLQKLYSHKLTAKAVRGASNSRHERNRVKGTVIIISRGSHVFYQQQVHLATYLCQKEVDTFHVRRKWIVETAIKKMVGSTPHVTRLTGPTASAR
jgi:hypothetical protein